MLPGKPRDMFDRDREWCDLASFVLDEAPGPRLGIVTGRRRQGKTFLLDAVARATGGFYFAATEATETEELRRLGQALAAHLDAPAAFELRTWEEAVNALLALGRRGPTLVVLDEFPYLARSAPALPSVIQAALMPGRASDSRTRLLLCGSAMSFMGGLLSGSAPLRGRAGLELHVPPLSPRLAAEFWGAEDPRLAVLLHSVVGGTPAYRREYARDDVPSDLADFDDWVVRAVLNPASPLFREARYLLAEEPDLRDRALYHSVLAAIADGNASRGGIANYIGRRSSDLAHPLAVLEDTGLIARDADPLRGGRGTYRIVEPLITFYQAVMRPSWIRLERRRAEEVWPGARRRFESAVLGPHFEQLCRDWVLDYASPETLGGEVGAVGRAELTDARGRATHEVDIVALAEPTGGPRRVLAIGEAKWGRTVGMPQLERLRLVRGLLERRRGFDVSGAVLICASASGFADELRSSGEAVLLDLDRLYRGE